MQDNKLLVIFNKEPVLEFDRNKPLPGKQRQYLDRMDERMNQGIQLGDTFIENPNPLQRAQFVANSLVNALLKQDFNQAIAMCTFLGNRMPELQQIQCEGTEGEGAKDSSEKDVTSKGKDGGISIEFIYDRSYEQSQQEQPIQFYKPEKPSEH
jgi:hypothetical protein